jgi:hypothetical protein
MAISFGHMHRDDLGLPPLTDAVGQTLFAAGISGAAALARRHRHPAVPDDYCPICAGMALVATALPSQPPVLITPEPFRRVSPAQTPVHGVALKVALSFQARAPPSV